MVSKVIYHIDIDKKWVKFLQNSLSDWKMGRNLPVRKFWTDRKSQEKSHKILEKSGNFRRILFIIFLWYTNELCIIWLKFTVQKQKHSKNTGKWKKYLKSLGILPVRKSGHVYMFCHVVYTLFSRCNKSCYCLGRNLWQGTGNCVVSAI